MRKRLGFALIAASAMVSGAAQADVTWYVTGTFDDGGTLSGYFTVDVYGYPTTDYSITTTGGTSYAGLSYKPIAESGLNSSNPDNTPALVVFSQDFTAENLYLNFADLLKTGSAHNPITTGSYECDNFCGGAPLRTLTSGFASIDPIPSVPEPASWALMIAGFGLTGAAVRRAKVRTVTYA